MDNSVRLEQLRSECQLKDSDFYFLELIPLIEMMWSDNQNQEPELHLIYKFTSEHIARVCDAADGEEVITAEQANDFLDRFAHKRPEKQILAALKAFVFESWREERPSEQKEALKQSILEYCLDIAASCVDAYPYGYHQRVTDGEKLLLKELMIAINIDPDKHI